MAHALLTLWLPLLVAAAGLAGACSVLVQAEPPGWQIAAGAVTAVTSAGILRVLVDAL